MHQPIMMKRIHLQIIKNIDKGENQIFEIASVFMNYRKNSFGSKESMFGLQINKTKIFFF